MERRRYRIGFITSDAGMFSATAKALGTDADLVRLSPTLPPGDAEKPDILLVAMGDAVEEAIRFLARLREKVPSLPVILLAQRISVNLAVEFVRFGGMDLMEMPIDPGALWRKIERAVEGVSRPAYDHPALTLLSRPEPAPVPPRRTSFRVRVPGDHPASVFVQAPKGARLQTAVEDLSIPTDGESGGMRLAVDEWRAISLGVGAWPTGATFEADLSITGETAPLPLRLQLVRPPLSVGRHTGRRYLISVSYALVNPQQEPTLQKFWIALQRHQAADVRPG